MCVQMKGIHLGLIWNKGWKIPWVTQKVMAFHIYLCSQKWNCQDLGCQAFLRLGYSRRSPFGSCLSLEFSWGQLRQHKAGTFFCFCLGRKGLQAHPWVATTEAAFHSSSKLFRSEFCHNCLQHKAGFGWDQANILQCSRRHFFPSVSGQQPGMAAPTPHEPEAVTVVPEIPKHLHQFPSATRTAL